MSWRNEWWTKEQVLEELSISERTFYRWLKKHTIQTARLTRRHPLVYRVEDVDAAHGLEHNRNPIKW